MSDVEFIKYLNEMEKYKSDIETDINFSDLEK